MFVIRRHHQLICATDRAFVNRLRPTSNRAGFTLVEMAMVIVIIGLVMLTVFPALNAVRIANERMLTQSNLRNLMLATASYVQANGCLPCPASATANGPTFGQASTANACGACAVVEGIAPFVTLGLPSATAHDGWGHWFTMRVDPALTVLPTMPPTKLTVFIPPTAICSATDATNGYCATSQAGSSAKGLCRSNIATAGRIKVTTAGGATQQAAVIFVSHGKNGYGSFVAQPIASEMIVASLQFPGNYADCSLSGGYAKCNAANAVNNIRFVDAPMKTGDTDPYDDILAYADRNTLVSMLGNGSCQTVW